MRVGTLCFAIERGLGYLAKSFHDAGIITDVAVLEHGRIPTHLEWYQDPVHITTRPYLNDNLKSLIAQVEVMLFFETPFDWNIIPYCQQQGVKTVLMPMYECAPHTIPDSEYPDLMLCPSLLDKEYFPKRSVYLPVPVEEPWKQRTRAKVFVHNCGYIGLRGRHGTLELLQAWKHVKSDAGLHVQAQTPELMKLIDHPESVARIDSRITWSVYDATKEELWAQGDVCIDPSKFNGLSLPLQEAMAAGMLVMAANRFPENSWLPRGPLIPVSGYRKVRTASRFIEFDEAIIRPEDIAAKVDEWYDRDITNYSAMGKLWAMSMSWDVLRSQYLTVLAPDYEVPS